MSRLHVIILSMRIDVSGSQEATENKAINFRFIFDSQDTVSENYIHPRNENLKSDIKSQFTRKSFSG